METWSEEIETGPARMLAAPLHRFSGDYLVTADETTLATLELARLRSRVRFQVEGEEHAVRSAGLLHRVYVLEVAGRELGRAERESLLPPTYRIRAGNRTLLLRARLPGRAFTVLHGQRVLGGIRPLYPFSRQAVLEGMEVLPLATRLFLLAIVLVHWRGRARAAASSGG